MCVICTTGAFMRGILLTNWGSHFVPGPTALFQVLLIAHSCNGMVRMNIYRNGKLLRTTEPFSGFRRYSPWLYRPSPSIFRFLVINVRRGQLRFEIVNEDSRPKNVRLWASTSSHKSPYPMLPEDTRYPHRVNRKKSNLSISV